jgi:hypothetical protein
MEWIQGVSPGKWRSVVSEAANADIAVRRIGPFCMLDRVLFAAPTGRGAGVWRAADRGLGVPGGHASPRIGSHSDEVLQHA